MIKTSKISWLSTITTTHFQFSSLHYKLVFYFKRKKIISCLYTNGDFTQKTLSNGYGSIKWKRFLENVCTACYFPRHKNISIYSDLSNYEFTSMHVINQYRQFLWPFSNNELYLNVSICFRLKENTKYTELIRFGMVWNTFVLNFFFLDGLDSDDFSKRF